MATERKQIQRNAHKKIAKPKGIVVRVYRDGSSHMGDSDCTNKGLSSRFVQFVLIGDGIPKLFEASDIVPALKLVRRTIYGKEYLHAEPMNPVPEDSVGWMFGGNFIYTSDARFPNKYPIPIHDRSETSEQYDLMSQ